MISSWTCRFLSYAGRLQLIKVVFMRIVNFWSAVFRIPSKCIKEVEQICSAFLWTGPELKITCAKVAWKDVCMIKNEGGLGLRYQKKLIRCIGLSLFGECYQVSRCGVNGLDSTCLRAKVSGK